MHCSPDVNLLALMGCSISRLVVEHLSSRYIHVGTRCLYNMGISNE